jgi:ParB family chromosome partitioning protein
MNKKTHRRVLGRGLSALIPAAVQDTDEERGEGQEIVSIDSSLIQPNPFQPRREFNQEEIQSLADSIKVQGLLQPVLVRQKENRKYEIVTGERRFRALRLLNRDKIPCVVRTGLADREMMEIALVENIQREDLNEIEKAEAFQRLLQEYDYTHDQVAHQVGKSRSAVTNTLRLLNLSEGIRQMVRQNIITMGHARALLSIEDETVRLAIAKRIKDEGLSVREVEKAVQSTGRKNRPDKKTVSRQTEIEPDTKEAIKRLEYKLGTPVTLKPLTTTSGKIEIQFFSESDLTRIFDLLLPEKRDQPGE